MKHFSIYALIVFLFSFCNSINSEVKSDIEIKGVEMSYLPEIRQSGIVVKNANGKPEDMLITIKNAGVNVVRLRIWHSPAEPNSNFESIKKLSQEIKNLGMKVLLTVHYSDDWADPGKQIKPIKWKNLAFNDLIDSVYNYTSKIIKEINPEYIQIGNEINNGLLWDDGKINNFNQMKKILISGIKAVRNNNKKTKIMLQYAGYKGLIEFFDNLSGLDYDLIGVSYYPNWHGKSLDTLKQNILNVSEKHNKLISIIETSYPFTFEYNDYTNNIIGSKEQILDEFPPTTQGQKDFLSKIKQIIISVPKGNGFCYWGSEWISYKGKNSQNGSTWENQALWDYNNKVLPVLDVYN